MATGTVNLGTAGGQFHIATITKVDPDMPMSAYLNNVQFSCMQDVTLGVTSGSRSSTQGFTFYLNDRSAADGWADSSPWAVSSIPQGGNGNLTARRYIRTDFDPGPAYENYLGPVHVWMEGTDISSSTNAEARVTLTAWGRMHKLTGDF